MTHPGVAAKRLLSDPVFGDAIDAMREDVKNEFANTPLDRPEQMVRLRIQLQCIESLVQKLNGYVYDLEQLER